ncbi:MAG: IS21 family transposase, partial [Solirubrobacterales bacterium]
MIGVEQWAEIRRMKLVEGRSIGEIARLMGCHRDTVRRALAADRPPRYERGPQPSKLDPFLPRIQEL